MAGKKPKVEVEFSTETAAKEAARLKRTWKTMNKDLLESSVATNEAILKNARDNASKLIAVQNRIAKSVQANQAKIQQALNNPGGPRPPGGGGGGGGNNPPGGGGSGQIGQIFGGTILGGIIGGGAAGAVGFALQKVTSLVTNLTSSVFDLGVEAVNVGAKFEVSVNALTVFTGSVSKAKSELASIDKISQNTTGLRLDTARVGYTRLRALGFEAKTAESLIAGLAKQRYLSGATDQDIERVIVNLNQLSSGSSRASQDIKEMVHSIPSLRKVLFETFGTLDYKKIGKIVGDNPDAAFDKFAKALNSGKQAAGGLDNSIEKFYDSWKRAAILFSEPILPGLTADINELTESINGSESTFTSWGKTVSDTIRGVADTIRGLKAVYDWLGLGIEDKDAGYLRQGLRKGGWMITNATVGLATGGLTVPLTMAKQYGEIQRQEEEAQKELNKVHKYRFGSGGRLSADQLAEKQAEAENKEFKRQQQEEIARQSSITKLKASQAMVELITKDQYDTLDSMLRSHITYTLEQERELVLATTKNKKEGIQQQIADTKNYYDKLLANMESGSDEYVVTEAEKNHKLTELNGQLVRNGYDTQKQLAEIDRRIVEQKRAAGIELANLKIQGVGFNRDNDIYEINREIQKTGGNAETQFAKLVSVYRSSYNEIVKLTNDSFQKQLEDESLSAEQRQNLNLKWDQELLRLAEEQKRNINAIEDQKRDKVLENLEFIHKATVSMYADQASQIGAFQSGLFASGFLSSDRLKMFKDVVIGEGAARKFSSTKKAYDSAINKGPGDDMKEWLSLTSRLFNEMNKAQVAFDKFNGSVSDSSFEFAQMAEMISTKNLPAIDALSSRLLARKQELETAQAGADVGYWGDILKLAEIDKNDIKKREAKYQLESAQRRQQKLDFEQALALSENFEKSLEGVNKRLWDVYNDDKTRAGIMHAAIVRIGEDRIEYAKENIYLEEKLARVGEDAADRYRRAWLEATMQVRDADIQAKEDQIRSLIRLGDMNNIHTEQIRAKILGHLAEQKSISENIADSIIEVYDAAGSAIDKVIDKSGVGKIPGIGSFVKGMARSGMSAITKALLDSVLPGSSDELEKAQNPMLGEAKSHTKLLQKIEANTRGAGSGGAQGLLDKVLGGGSSQGSGGGSGLSGLEGLATGHLPGVPGSPEATGAAGGGSIFDRLKASLFDKGGIFGPRRNILTGQDSKLAGILGGAGSIATMIGGAIGGRAGHVLGMAGTGANLGASFGPWGAAIGAGIGAIAGLFTMGRNAKKRLKKAAQNAYQIDIKDDSIVDQLQAIGDGTYGKGQSASRADEVVRLDMARELLLAYAQRTGQNVGLLEGELYFDENYSKNINRISAMPTGTTASISSASVGGSNMQAALGGSTAGAASGSSGMEALLKTTIGVMSGVMDVTEQLNERLTSMPASEMVALGLKEKPEIAANAMEQTFRKDPYRAETLFRNTGQQ